MRRVPLPDSLIDSLCSLAALGLLGEIRIAKDTDYNKWGIEILVSFRDKEALQVLTAHRQSGGMSFSSLLTILRRDADNSDQASGP